MCVQGKKTHFHLFYSVQLHSNYDCFITLLEEKGARTSDKISTDLHIGRKKKKEAKKEGRQASASFYVYEVIKLKLASARDPDKLR